MTDLTALLARYGSPLYVYKVDCLDAAVADLRAMLPAGATLFYSVKANPHPGLGARLRLAGCRAEISSSGELDAALAAGFPMGECLYTGPAKTPTEIRTALCAGVRQFSVESTADLGRVADGAVRAGVTARCLVRVNLPMTGASGLRMSGAGQFGTDLATVARQAGEFRDRPGVNMIGAHFFAASGVRGEEALIGQTVASIRAAARLRDEVGLSMSILDLGGGFAAPYGAPGVRPRYPGLRDQTEEALDEHFVGWRDGDPEIAFESGRYLVADSGTLVCTVTEIKQHWVLLDSGINHLGGMAGLGLMLPSASAAAEAESVRRATLAGPLCTPADVLGRNVPVADGLVAGDQLAIPNVGAYGLSASLMGFLSRPAPVEVVIDGEDVVSASRVGIVRTSIEL